MVLVRGVVLRDIPLTDEWARTGEDLEGKDQRKYQRGRCDSNWSNSQAIIRNLTKHQSPDLHTPRYCSLSSRPTSNICKGC